MKHPIAVRELYPIMAVINGIGHRLVNSRILFHCDNQAIVEVINRQSSKDKKIMSLPILRPLILALPVHNIAFRAEYIPSNSNSIADTLSHTQPTKAFLLDHGLQEYPVQIPSHMKPENLKLYRTESGPGLLESNDQESM